MKIEFPIKIYTGNFDSLFKYESLEDIKAEFLMDLAIMGVEQIMNIVITRNGQWVSLVDYQDENAFLGDTKEEKFTEFLFMLVNLATG